MNLSNLVILLFTLIASTAAAALIGGTNENEITLLKSKGLAVEEPSEDVLGQYFSNVNKRSIYHGHSDSHRHGFTGHRRNFHHRHRYHPHNRYSASYTNNQMKSPAAFSVGKRLFSHRHSHRHHTCHRGHGHRHSSNRQHQEVPTETTTTTAEDRDRSREEIIESIFNKNDNTWDNLLEPITDSPFKSTTNSKGLLYDIDLRSSF